MATTINNKDAIVMTNPDQKQLNEARDYANNAFALNEVARQFKAMLVAYAEQQPKWRGLAVLVADSRTTGSLNFRLKTVHGAIEVLFDQAFHFGRLVGRYRFITVADTAIADVEAREIWTMLFDENYRATWDPEEDFRWHFTPERPDVPDSITRLIQILLFRSQAEFAQYPVT